MKRIIAGIMSAVLNLLYRLSLHGGRSNLVGFISRQSDKPTADFRALARAFDGIDGWQTEFRIRALHKGLRSEVSFAFQMVAEVRLLARCRICFVEGYNPALSMLHLKSVDLHSGTPNASVPMQPVVIQLWHAGGMFKKFGYQTVGTPQGHSAEDAELFHMHANYSWIVCSGESVRPVFAEAFGYPESRVVALGRASSDALLDRGNRDAALERVRASYPHLLDDDRNPVVVLAPTLRKGDEQRPFDELRAHLAHHPLASKCNIVWSDHPVVVKGASVSTADLLYCADLLVTDYSSCVYDAALLGVPFTFYVPDIERYRISPGLNSDPMELAPNISFADPERLASFIEAFINNRSAYPQDDADAFIGDSLSASGRGSTQRIVNFAMRQVNDDER